MSAPPSLHVTTRSRLRERGVSRRRLDRAITDGVLRPVGRQWLATESTPPAVVSALSVHARLTCVDALAIHGLYVPLSSGIHVTRLRDGGGRALGPGMVAHGPLRAWPDDEAIVPIPLALRHAARCVTPDELAMLFDSAAHRRLMPLDELEEIRRTLPQKTQRAMGRIEPLCAAGTESRVRRWAERRGVRVVPQWQALPGVRVDLRLGDRLVIECDSVRHHTDSEAYHRDRHRDRALVGLGLTVIRLTWEDVMVRWEQTRTSLDQLIRSGLHRDRRRRA